MGDVVNIPGREGMDFSREIGKTNALKERILDAIEADPTLTVCETVGILELIKFCFMEQL